MPHPINNPVQFINKQVNSLSVNASTGLQQNISLAQPIVLTGEVHQHKILQAQEFDFEIGVDEVGRGPLYGSVVVAACILPSSWSQGQNGLSGDSVLGILKETPLASLTDSKKLSEKKREHLFPLIKKYALGFVIVEIPASVIDQINILQATLTGMRLGCESIIEAITMEINKEFQHPSQQVNTSYPRTTSDKNSSQLLSAKNLANDNNTESNFDTNGSKNQQMNLFDTSTEVLNYNEDVRTSNEVDEDFFDKAVIDKQSVIAGECNFKLLIDGNKVPALDWQFLNKHNIEPLDAVQNELSVGQLKAQHTVTAEAWVKGDSRHTAIAAASVLAKVTRDRKLVAAGEQYPQYGLEKHKGYPIKVHLDAIEQFGVLDEHRRSFKPVRLAIVTSKRAALKQSENRYNDD